MSYTSFIKKFLAIFLPSNVAATDRTPTKTKDTKIKITLLFKEQLQLQLRQQIVLVEQMERL